MTIEDSNPNPTHDHLLDWLGDSISFLPSSFLDYPYSGEINGYELWDPCHDLHHPDVFVAGSNSHNSSTNTNIPASELGPTVPLVSDDQPSYDSSKKRKNPTRQINDIENGSLGASIEEMTTRTTTKRPAKKSRTKGSGSNGNNGNKDGRWAEQLLLPCAAAATAGNLSRVQHLLYVVNELASATGDANHRLAYHGLRALTHHLSAAAPAAAPFTFAASEPSFFQKSLLKFNELSPWFAFPNTISNASILQILADAPDPASPLHILDIGVSHGVQWPTLLEALSRRSGGPPPLVRLTIVSAAAETDQTAETPFAVGPPGDNFTSCLLNFAQTLKINLEINLLDDQLQTLNPQILNSTANETLIISAQFRLHHLNHTSPDDRSQFLSMLAKLNPKGLILSENNSDCSCNACGDFATGFSRRVEGLWRFLDSTSAAFKGRESEERRLMEGEAAKGLTNRGEMNEGKEKWGERMRGCGFVGVGFGEDAMDGARALLRKYDGNWEMKMEEKDGSVSFWWKGQAVSFCSLWKVVDVKKCES